MSLLTQSWLCRTLEVLEKEAEEHTILSAFPFLLFTFFSYLRSIAFIWNISKVLLLPFPDKTSGSCTLGLTNA